jgi:hypothetical protein
MNTIQLKKMDETRIAEQILSVLPAGVARAVSEDRGLLRYCVRAEGLKLKTIVLSRASLRKLIEDPAREVKIEYLRRDLERSAARRAEFRYPRASRIAAAQSAASRLRQMFGMPMASAL